LETSRDARCTLEDNIKVGLGEEEYKDVSWIKLAHIWGSGYQPVGVVFIIKKINFLLS
jgi:hypothetical protein